MAKSGDMQLMRRMIRVEDRNMEKSLYALQMEENGYLQQKGIGCAIEAKNEDEVEYFLVTSDAVVSKNTFSKEKPVIANRYRSKSSKNMKDHHVIQVSDPQDLESEIKDFSFLRLHKAPKWYLRHELQEHVHKGCLERKPVLVAHTFCDEIPVELRFVFDSVAGQYKLRRTEPPEADTAKNKRNVIGAPLLISQKPDFVVGVVGTSDNGDDLCPFLFYGLPGSVDTKHKMDSKKQQARKKIKPRNELPEEPQNIRGRVTEVNEVVQSLSGTSSTSAVLVYGGAGYGKTTIAIQASYQITRTFDSHVLFCSLRGFCCSEEDICRNILSICTSGKLTSENPKYELLNWCRKLEHKIVIVLDNAEDALEDDIRDLFISLIEQMRKCSQMKMKFLITSRQSDVFLSIGNLVVKPIQVGPLNQTESIEILKFYSGLQSEVETAKFAAVAEKCENVPLALRLAGPLLSPDSEYSVDELIHDLEDCPTTTLKGTKHMIKIAFEKLDKALQHALVSLSVFVGPFDKDAAKALLGKDCAKLLSDLRARSLIQKDQRKYSLHLLIRDYARETGRAKLFDILSLAKKAFFEHFLSLILSNTEKFWGKDSCKVSIELFKEERLNLEFCLKNATNCEAIGRALNECRLIASYVEYCVPFKVYIEFLTRLLGFAREKKQEVHEIEILCLLAHEARKHGNDQQLSEYIKLATEMHEQCKDLVKEIGDSEVFYLYHYGRHLSQDCREREEASIALKEAIAICEVNECDSHPDLPRILAQLGHDAKFRGEHEKAHKQYSRALSYRQKFRGEHLLTAFAYKDLADNYLYVSEFENAEQNYQEAIHILKKMEVLEQKEVVPILKNFAICNELHGNVEKARKLYEQGSAVAENTIEGNHKWKVWIRTKLALLILKNYSGEVALAMEIAAEVFRMSSQLKLKKWDGSTELLELYNEHKG